MKKKKFIALARVSSREQEREGFSLDIQVDALNHDAERRNGTIIKLWRIAETASKKDERKTFKELIAFAKKHAAEIDGILFYKIDRAARNLFDYVELEGLESEFNVPFFSVTQPTENTPAGRMQRRMLASMASFYTEQQSLDVREGVKRRVESGLFPQKAPFGYRNVRVDKRGLVEVDPVNSLKVRRIFDALRLPPSDARFPGPEARRRRHHLNGLLSSLRSQQGVRHPQGSGVPGRSQVPRPVAPWRPSSPGRSCNLGPGAGPPGRQGLPLARTDLRWRTDPLPALRSPDHWRSRHEEVHREGIRLLPLCAVQLAGPPPLPGQRA